MKTDFSSADILKLLQSDQKFSRLVEGALSGGKSVVGLSGSLASFFAASLLKKNGGQNSIVCVVANGQEALALKSDIQSAFCNSDFPIDILDGWGVLPYTAAPTGGAVFGERVAALLSLSRAGFHIVTLRALLAPCVPKKYLAGLCLVLTEGQSVDPTKIGEQLTKLGYFRVPRVTGRCEYSTRGEVIDIFPPAADKALRATLDYDKIDSIKEFDPETQSTTKRITFATIIPTKEVLWTDDKIDTLSALFDDLIKTKGITPKSFGGGNGRGFSGAGKVGDGGSFSDAGKATKDGDGGNLGGKGKASNKGNASDGGKASDVAKDGDTGNLGNRRGALHDSFQKAGQLGFAFDDGDEALQKNCSAIIEKLIDNSSAPKEEQFFGFLWGEEHDVSEYFDREGVTIFFAYERLLTESENLKREVLGMYQRTHLTSPCIPPQRYLVNLSKIEKKSARAIKLLLFDKDDNGNFGAQSNFETAMQNPTGNFETAGERNVAQTGDSGFGQKDCSDFAQTDGPSFGQKDKRDFVREGGGFEKSGVGNFEEEKADNFAQAGDDYASGGEGARADNGSDKKNDGAGGNKNDGAGGLILRYKSTLGTSFFGNVNILREELGNLLGDGWTVFVFGNNPNQALRLDELLKEYTHPEVERAGVLSVVGRPINIGFCAPEIKLRVISENEIFGRRKSQTAALKRSGSLEKESKALATSSIDTFVDLNPGDFVVHVKYGIGVFRGIERVKTAQTERDYIKLEYAEGDSLFVPIEQVNLVQRYIGREGEAVKLDKIGATSWAARKAKVRKAVEDLARHLISLYAKRQASRGFACKADDEWSLMFEASFPYEDTPDQTTATSEIKRDMESVIPMDRLLCGDVGFGKTEVAMRAAFKAVMNGRQVAFLCPTTILSEQHFETFSRRFKGFPVTIAKLSRFVPPAEVRKTIVKIREGAVDIVIGTHRLIQKDVVFKKLGLLVIDEEQRFGVKDKERLKTFKANIDCLALSATPIPRTLHMSILKIRDMSLLTTPPQNRQPIATYVSPWSDDTVAAAIRRECQRGGQVFFLHNKIESLEETRFRLARLVPELSIETAHGQMAGEELDEIFHRFKLQAFQVLIATTIIENGIDIPNVNTIIIDRADMYGVSQLYQLRGRVGRSDRRAYAYLLYNQNKNLSEIAMKRLQAISDFTELGSGFKIAMRDMELRGAGNLLGRDQSGAFYSVGFDMYVRLLNEAVQALLAESGGALPSDEDAVMELEYTGFIPDSYISSPQIKMEIYKKISAISDDASFNELSHELNDRFGPVPEEVSALLSICEIKILCKALHIASIKERAGVASVEFSRVKDINVTKVITLIKGSSGLVRLDPARPNVIMLTTRAIPLKDKAAFIKERLEAIV